MRPIAFLLGALVASSPAAAESWKEYAYPSYSFAVAFPAAPKIETTTYQAADGRSVQARVYSVTQDNVAFAMTIADLSDTAMDERAVIGHAIRTLAQGGEIKVNISHSIKLVFGRQLSILGADGSRSSVAVFYYKRRLYQIEAKAFPSGHDGTADAIRFQQSLVFTDNGEWQQLVDRARGECLRQFQYLRAPGQAENVREHMSGCVMAKLQAEVRKAASERRASGAPVASDAAPTVGQARAAH